jgi:hypothetical protein
MKDSAIVGAALAEVLPVTNKYWFQIPHLLKLNLILLVPLLSSSVAGYDGMFVFYTITIQISVADFYP